MFPGLLLRYAALYAGFLLLWTPWIVRNYLSLDSLIFLETKSGNTFYKGTFYHYAYPPESVYQSGLNEVETNKRWWDMGQEPDDGWVKVAGAWCDIGASDYSEPNKAFWREDDPRLAITAFDGELFRKTYDEVMPTEKPPIENYEQLALVIGEQRLAQVISERFQPPTRLTLRRMFMTSH